jgi:hypothetical protein
MNAAEYRGLKSILKKILLMSFLVGFTVATIIISVPFNDDNYYLALLEKHTILEKTPQPRIILIGGSNLAFGIDSEKMKNELNVSIVNSGLHAGIGLNYMLNDLKPYLNDGDIIIIIPEYDVVKKDGEPESLAAMIDMNPRSITYLNQKEFLNLHIIGTRLFRNKVTLLENNFFKKLELWSPPVTNNTTFKYTRYGFNQYGDEVSHLKFKSNDTLIFDYHNGNYSKNADDLVLLNEFDTYTKKRNISVYFSFPPIADEEYTINQSDYRNYYNFLKTNLSIKIIGTPEMFTFPKNYFFDSGYHLNSEGRENRTEMLIYAIRKAQIV